MSDSESEGILSLSSSRTPSLSTSTSDKMSCRSLGKNCQKTIESLVLQMVKLSSHFPLGQADQKIEHVSSSTQGFGSLLLICAVGELGRMVAIVTNQRHRN